MFKSHIPCTAALLFLAACLLLRHNPHAPGTAAVFDTIVVRDTIRDTVPLPCLSIVHHYDTVFLPSASDSTSAQVVVPIQQRRYVTENYTAVVEGFAPRLTAIELYPQTRTVVPSASTGNARRLTPRFGIGVGIGYDPFSRHLHPVVSAGIYIPVSIGKRSRQTSD